MSCLICLRVTDSMDQLTHNLEDKLMKICPEICEYRESKICQTCKLKLLDASEFQDMCYSACSILKQRNSALVPVVKEEIYEKQDINTDPLSEEEEELLEPKYEDQFSDDQRIDSHLYQSEEENESINIKNVISFMPCPTFKDKQKTDLELFSCEICNDVFHDLVQLKFHYSGIHNQKLNKNKYQKNEKFRCYFCNYIFYEKEKIEQHMRAHVTENRPYQCKTCFFTFKKQKEFSMHLDIHKKVGPLVGAIRKKGSESVHCCFCYEELANEYQFCAHLRGHKLGTKDATYRCSRCSKTFHLKILFIRHIRTHEDRKFTCDICEKRFIFKSQLETHMQAHRGLTIASNIIQPTRNRETGTVKCPFCPEEFQEEVLLCDHYKIHRSETINGTFKCSRCPKCFVRKMLYKRHIRIHDDRKFKCDICPRTFIFMFQLTQHRLTHDGSSSNEQCNEIVDEKPKIEEEFSCNVCGETFNSKRKHSLHKNTHETTGAFRLCPECGKPCRKGPNYFQHMKRHRKRQKVLCSICGKELLDKFILQHHMKVHTNQCDYQCELCPSKFKSKVLLYNHKILHGEKKFECDICGTKFSRKETLKTHLRLHSGNLPYLCTWQECKKKFNSSSQLKNHYRTHTGEKPFACSFCKQTFSQRYDMIKHSRIHADPHKCNQCPATFKLKRDLLPHIQEHLVADRAK